MTRFGTSTVTGGATRFGARAVVQGSGLPDVPMPEQEPNTLQWMLSPFTVWGTWSTQLFGSYEENIRAARGLFDPDYEGYEFRAPQFSTYEQAAMGQYPNPEDIGLAASYRARVPMGIPNPLYAIEESIRGPETGVNQFLSSGRLLAPDEEFVQQYWRGVEIAREVAPEVFASPQNIAAQTLFGGAITLGSEQMIMETMNDPLIIFDAFNVGSRIVNGINRGAGRFRQAVPVADRALTAVRNFADTVGTAAHREVYRATRNIMGEAAYQRGMMQVELGELQRGVQQAGGEAWARGTTFEGEVMPEITRLLESPRDLTDDISLTRRMFGYEEAVDDIMEMVTRQMPDAPPMAQRRIAEFLNRAWELGERLPEIENLFDMPTQRLLSNIEYAKHVYADEARRAAYRSLPAWRQRLNYSFENALGQDLVNVLRRRRLRDTISNLNELAADGMIGFANGKLIVLKQETANLNRVSGQIWRAQEKLNARAYRQAASLQRILDQTYDQLVTTAERSGFLSRQYGDRAVELFEFSGAAPVETVGPIGVGLWPYSVEGPGWRAPVGLAETGEIVADPELANRIYDLAARSARFGEIHGRTMQTAFNIGETMSERGAGGLMATIPAEAFIEKRVADDLAQLSREVRNMPMAEAEQYLTLYRNSLADQLAQTPSRSTEMLLGVVDEQIDQISQVVAAHLDLLESGELVAGVRAGRMNPARIKRILDEVGFGSSIIPDLPDNFVPVTKLFNDNPWQILFSRYGQHTRAVAAARMLTDAANNPAFVMARDAVNGPTIADVVGKAEFNRTFGRLGDDLVDLATNTRWRDHETAQAVLEWARTARDLTDRPNAILNALDTAISVWRGQTLTPFLGYHMRNVVGGLLNVLMSGKADIFDIIDATFPMTGNFKFKGSTAWAWDQFRRMGLDRTGEVRTAWSSTQKYLYDDPLLGTPIQSAWDVIREFNPFGRGGRTAGAAIENQQRFAMFLGAVRRGMSVEDATEMAYKYLFDYMDVPRWFKHGSLARRVSAFPTWTMKNIPLQLERMITRPNIFSMRGRVYNSIIRASGRANEPMPSYLEEQQGFAAPGGGFLALENFDPVAAVGEVADIVRPLLEGDLQRALRPTIDFIDNLLNPFITAPVEQSMYSHPVGSPGEPGGMTYGDPTIPEAQPTGWDFFRERPVYRDYSRWNEAWAAFGLEGKMPEWAQRADHVLRSFVRAYNETSSVIAEMSRMSRGESDYGIPEYGARRALGVPYFQANVDKTIYFSVRDMEREIAAMHDQIDDGVATPDQVNELKDIYMRELGYLAHGTFMELDPWSGEPRPWLDVANEGEYTIKGRQRYFREFADTCHLLLYGRRGIGNSDIHQPIPLDDSERELIEGLLDACVQSYRSIMYMYAANNAEINIQDEENWIERRAEEPGGETE